MASSATSLYDLAAELLVQAQAALATTPSGVPARAFVSNAPPAFDCCPQLTVHATQLGQAPAGPSQGLDDQRRLQYGSLNMVNLVVTAIRCAPTPQGDVALPVATLTTSAQEVYRDGWVLWCYLSQRFRAGQLFAGFPCRPVSIGAATPVEPQGGCVGWLVPMSVQLDGYAAS